MISKEKINKILKYTKNHSLEEVAAYMGVTEETLLRDYRRIREAGYSVTTPERSGTKVRMQSKIAQTLSDSLTEKEIEMVLTGIKKSQESTEKKLNYSNGQIKFGIISDTHIGHMNFHPEYLEQAFEEFDKEDVSSILHTGDVTEGFLRPDIIYELTHVGFKAQRDYTIELFREATKPVYFIDGNHDRSFIKLGGAFIVEDIVNSLNSISGIKHHYLGSDEGSIFLDGNIEIRLWHGGDGACFDEETEILTKEEGFIPFRELTKSHNVATMNKETSFFEWQHPDEITNNYYKGDVYKIKHRCIDLLVTPKHNLWVKHNEILKKTKISNYPTKSHITNNYTWHTETIEDIYTKFTKQKYLLPSTVTPYSNVNELDRKNYIDIPYVESKNKGMIDKMNHIGTILFIDLAELIAWYVTEGSSTKKVINISQYKEVNPDKYLQIEKLLIRIGCSYSSTDKGFTIYSKELVDYLVSICGKGSYNKYLPSFIKEAPLPILNTVFRTMLLGDGNTTSSGFSYTSFSKKLLEDFGLIALKLGWAMTYSNNRVSLRDIQITPALVKKPEKIEYEGRVYCCSVLNELIYVRRNGKCIWSHNSYSKSYRLQKIVESLKASDKPAVLIAGHDHKSLYMPQEQGVHVLGAGTLQDQTKWMRGKRLSAAVGFWIITLNIDNGRIAKCVPQWYEL